MLSNQQDQKYRQVAEANEASLSSDIARIEAAIEEVRLAELYQAAKDENELLEFKNYELLFKIQELEQNQEKMLNNLVDDETTETTTSSIVASPPEEFLISSIACLTGHLGIIESKLDKGLTDGLDNEGKKNSPGQQMKPPTTTAAPLLSPAVRIKSPIMEQHNRLGHLNEAAQGCMKVAFAEKVGQQQQPDAATEATEARLVLGALNLVGSTSRNSSGEFVEFCKQANGIGVEEEPKSSSHFGSLIGIEKSDIDYLEHENMSHQRHAANVDVDVDYDDDDDEQQQQQHLQKLRQLDESDGRATSGSIVIARNGDKTNKQTSGLHAMDLVSEHSSSDCCYDSNNNNKDGSVESHLISTSSLLADREAANRKYGQLIEYNGTTSETSLPLLQLPQQQAVVQMDKMMVQQQHHQLSILDKVGGVELGYKTKVELGSREELLTNGQSDIVTSGVKKQTSGLVDTSEEREEMGNPATGKLPAAAVRKLNNNSNQQQLNRSQPDPTINRGAARVAVPITRRIKPQQVSNQQHQRSSYLKTRSKSNLDQVSRIGSLSSSTSSLPRRTKQDSSLNLQVANSIGGSQVISKSIATKSLASEGNSKVATLQQQKQTNRSNSSSRSRSSSISSTGFVTQIPTLISQLHAPNSSAARLGAVAIGRNSSKSMSNLAVVSGNEVPAINDDDDDEAGSKSGFTSSTNLEPSLPLRRVANGLADKVDQSLAHSFLPKASFIRGKPTGKGCLSSSVSKLPMEISSSCMSLVSCELDDKELKQKETGNMQEETRNGQQMAIVHDLELSQTLVDVGNNCNKAEDSNKKKNLPQQQQQQQVSCAQCKLLQSKLNLLIMERKQMNEQINELEELENDSRLISQKLEQQLLLAEQHLDSCKLELQRTCDNESRLEFQNKRLNFELKQRLETIEQLQCQVSRLQTKVALAKTLDDGSSLSVVGRSMKANNNNNNNNNGTTNLTRNNPENGKIINFNDTNREKCPVSPTNNSEDDDSAIEEFEKGQKSSISSACDGSLSLSQEVDTSSLKQTGTCKQHADDSAYSKSSASSDDTNSDDGNRSDSDNSSKNLCCLNVSTNNQEQSLGEQQQPVVETKQLSKQLTSPSLTSSGDESDHHESGTSQQVVNLSSYQTTTTATNGQVPTQVAVVGLTQATNATTTTALGASDQTGANSPGATSNGLTGRQQVLRKKISTARILRGIQVQQQSTTILSTMTTTSATTTTTTCTNNSIKPNNNNQPEAQTLNHKSTVIGPLGQADSAQVALPVADGGLGKNLLSDQRLSISNDDIHRDKNQISKDTMQLTSVANNCYSKGPLELALEGVDNLELGRADEALKLLVESAENRQIEDADLVKQFRNEIASLKTRLLQAQTLNDNLVSKLNESRRVGQLTNSSVQVRYEPLPLKQQLLPVHYLPETSGGQQQQRQFQQQKLANNQIEQDHMRAQRSIVYVNGGVRATVEHRQTSNLTTGGPFNGGQQQVVCGGGGCGTVNNNNNSSSSTCYIGSYQYSSDSNNQQVARLSFSLDEFVETLKDLLEKVHFHHGRTFELVSECLKLAMNALLANYSHQMNLAHHSRVIMAGNKASQMYPHGEVEQFYNLQQQQLQQDMYPVRPPPRRRNAANRMMHYPADSLNEPSKRYETTTTPPQPPPSLVKQSQQPPTVSNGRTTAASALQAAKQTLFSIVPIYYNSNSGKQAKNKGNKEKCPESKNELYHSLVANLTRNNSSIS